MKFLIPEQVEKSRKHHLHKKLRLGELRELGFNFELTYDRNTLSHGDALDHPIDLVKAQGWMLGGGGLPEQAETSGYPCPAWVGSLNEADRGSTRLWLEA